MKSFQVSCGSATLATVVIPNACCGLGSSPSSTLRRKSQVPTLVYCGAGMSRSPAVVAAALSIVQGGSPEDRLREVVAGHPHDVSPQLWEAVCKVCCEKGRNRKDICYH